MRRGADLKTGWSLLLLALAGCGGSGPSAGPNLVRSEPSAPAPRLEDYRELLASAERPSREPGAVTARLNEEVEVGNVRVRPLAILEDTRCPIDLECMHAGSFRLRVSVSGVGEKELRLWEPLPIPGGEPLLLVAVAPPRWDNPPAGVDPNALLRLALRRGGAP
jgi:hypothetical protein